MLTAKQTNPITKAIKLSAPDPKNGIKNPGVVHATVYATGGIILNTMIHKYPIILHTIGDIINGTTNIGFITIGKPNTIGSLILNIPGKNDILQI